MKSEIWVVGQVLTRKGKRATVVKVDATCHEPEHSPDNPWCGIEFHNGSSYGCMKTLKSAGWESDPYYQIETEDGAASILVTGGWFSSDGNTP